MANKGFVIMYVRRSSEHKSTQRNMNDVIKRRSIKTDEILYDSKSQTKRKAKIDSKMWSSINNGTLKGLFIIM